MSTSPPLRLDLELVDRLLHDLRKPIAAIQAYADLLEEEVSGPLNAEQHDYAGTVLRNVERLDELLGQLRTLAALSTGGLVVTPRAVRVEELLARVEERHAADLHRCGLRFYLEVPDAGLEVRTDPAAFVEAAGRVLENSARLTPAGGEVALTARRAADEVHLEIRDTGPGIRSREIEQVFAPFHRTGARGEHPPPPTLGIGLTLARGIAEVLGGTLRAREQATGGASFVFALPAVENSPLPPGGEEREGSEATARARYSPWKRRGTSIA